MWKSRTRRACSRDNLAMIDLQTIQQAAERLQGQVAKMSDEPAQLPVQDMGSDNLPDDYEV